MNISKKLTISGILFLGIALGFAGCSEQKVAQTECGAITVAEMNWASAEMLAHIDKVVLENGYGCEVELVPGSTMPTATSMMEKGEPDVAPELWINAVRIALDAATAEGRLHYAAEVFSDTGEEGWWIPQYIADANPDIQTVEDALNRPDLFPHPEGDGAALYTCPSGWNCQLSTNNLFKAFGAEAKGFRLVDPGSGAGLSGAISKAYDQGEGWMGYYWAPTAILGKYPMKKLSFDVPHDNDEWNTCTSQEDCADPQKNSWVVSSVYTVVTDRFKQEAGVGMDYIVKRALPNSTINALLAWKEDNQATGADAAMHFLSNYSEWHDWVDGSAKAKIESAL
ncbi:ABC transporter substrate-binding protein [Pelagibacterales bacterium]|jgi:glycine betaine/proline transport system substrate-binding protein|nr:ABC transporter substrate-binding protein [Pelagibacterales bacterium]